MNRLPIEKRVQIVSALMEGMGVNATVRMTGISKPTILKLVADLGTACAIYHDQHVRNVRSKQIQCDEIWSFNYCKKINVKKAKAAPEGAGDVWTWTAIDDNKLIVTWLVANRDKRAAFMFMGDLARRIDRSVVDDLQITTDGLASYRRAAMFHFWERGHFAQLQKHYSATPDRGPGRKYSPGICIGLSSDVIYGDPDPKHISTSYVESHNQKIRQHNRRFTRLTSGHSKKIDNHVHHLEIYFTFYNFARKHSSLGTSPAVAAGLADHVWSIEELVQLMDAEEMAVAA